MTRIVFLLLLAAQTLNGQQLLPQIDIATIAISQGDHSGFIMEIPGTDQETVLTHWKKFTYLMFAPLQPGDEKPQFPSTVEDDANSNEFHTSGLYLPNLSQNPLEAYFLLEDGGDLTDKPGGLLTTRFSVAIDFGNNYFLDPDNVIQAEVIKHLLTRFYYSVVPATD